MPAPADIAAMQAQVYAVHGVPVVWTPAGGAAIGLTALISTGDQVGSPQGVGNFVTPVASVRFLVSEVVALAPGGVVPLRDDAVTIDGVDYLILGAPERQDPRRLEYTLDLAPA